MNSSDKSLGASVNSFKYGTVSKKTDPISLLGIKRGFTDMENQYLSALNREIDLVRHKKEFIRQRMVENSETSEAESN